ncbi:Integrator complex subunit 9 [Halotydeus destructor]|nr:Integrator complex subunit 9 [Halotydeus destructor]
MKFISLTDHPNKPCSILKFRDTLIMLDASLDMLSTSTFLPLPLVPSNHFNNLSSYSPRSNQDQALESELKEAGGRVFVDASPEFCVPDLSSIEMKHVDVILVSNYQTMMALPYITQYTDFNGLVYATEPTVQYARHFMDEMIEYIERTPKCKEAKAWKLPDQLKTIPFLVNVDQWDIKNWHQMYSKKTVTDCFSRIKSVGFNEKLDIFGILTATPLSSGHLIGSCNWLLNTHHEKIAYVSSSSTLTTHPKPIEYGPLKNADLLIMNNLSQTPTINPDANISELCTTIATTLKTGGNVLLPCYSAGVIYDLLEFVVNHLEASGCASNPIYFISPIADQSLAYSNILAEWLTASKQSRVYLPEEPFLHGQMVRIGRIKHYPGIHVEQFSADYKEPCVVFTGHPSLRFGEVVHFIELWGQSPKNIIIFTEPEFPYMEALSPYQPLQFKIAVCPVDTSLSFIQANKILSELKPTNVLIPEQYLTPPRYLPQRNDLIIESPGSKVVTYKKNEIVTLPIKRTLDRVELESHLSKEMVPCEVRPGVSLATVTGNLSAKDCRLKLLALSHNQVKELNNWSPGEQSLPPKAYTFGALDPRLLQMKLDKMGFRDNSIEQTPSGCIVHVRSHEAFLTIDENTTHIVCDASSAVRLLLRDLVVECLKKF